ncbi:hypothetical protein VMCG_05907 [Cytospora schulzeri]|uniref:Uncharacterized protein n=1 Tax=Cytospora schulzeri TaxID=448051 RepID=A0A423WD37_9PEZI|nr:hypothetical protein VMCG_05907 [Valsa malicola]
MESSAPKRRKTSPTSSVPVKSTTHPDPPTTQQQEQEQGPSAPTRPSQRPSFAAPTKSSLARSNPDVHARSQPTSSQRPEEPPASQPNTRDDDDAELTAELTAQLEHQSEGDGTPSSPSPPARQDADTATATRQAHSAPATTVQDQSEPQSPPNRAGGSTLSGHGQPQRHTPSRPRPEPRPLPPPGPENEEDLLNPFAGRARLPRSPLRSTGLLLPAAAAEEPELPPTPQHPDPVVSTPPSGIHNTPSKRRRAGNARGAAEARLTSPSKGASQPEKRPGKEKEQALGRGPGKGPQPQKEGHKQMTLRVARRGSPVQIVEEELPPSEKEKEPKGKEKDGFAPGTHPRRSVRLNPHVEKENERDALLREVAQLEADLEMARRENEGAAKGLPSTAARKDVLALLRRHLLPAGKTETETDAKTAWLETAMNPIAMLGFNGASSILLPPPIPQEKEEAEPLPTSHHPIPMTASEELPYLQVFTPLAFTSTITPIPPSPDHESGPTLHKHTIHVRSATPPGLFVARLEMTVNTRTHAVSALAVPRLDPAAAGELTPFINSVCSPQAPHHSALTRNVSVLAWAMGEWYRVALKRAKFWHGLESQLGPGAKDGLGEVVRAMRTRKRKRRRGGQHREADGGGLGESFESAGSGSGSGGGLDGALLSKVDLLPHMGRMSMDLEVPCFAEEATGVKSELRVHWGIEFDWTGEARSNLGVGIGVSGKWQAADDRKSFVGLPKLFDTLIQGGEDPLTAVKTVVALLAGEPTA